MESATATQSQAPCVTNTIVQKLLDEIHLWDISHGEREIQHRIDTLYNSNAIFLKSFACGISLGTLPLLIETHALLTAWWIHSTKKLYRPTQDREAEKFSFRMLGTLPLLLKTPVLLTALWEWYAKRKVYKDSFVRSALEIKAEDSFNRCYAWSVGSSPFLDPSHWEIISWVHMFASPMHQLEKKQSWQPLPERWYSRKGKLPVFQYNVDEET